MENLLNHILIGIAVLLMFSASIFVHEFGHFLVARWRGMKIEEFAIWCGPKIYSFRRKGILYSWRLFPGPIGGYVKLPQMVTSTAVEGKSEAVPPASPLSRILVAFAGPAMNVVFAFFIATVIYHVGLPVLVNPSVIGYVDPE
ncbi:MAG: site-2 protease family protein, partial [Verrucomicrobiae bacterium]|nr:site-2 protease family protein [Verrucomicrobiae bacterium]